MQQLRDMGIQDEELMLRALQATDGDIQAALELIFAGGPGLWAHTPEDGCSYQRTEQQSDNNTAAQEQFMNLDIQCGRFFYLPYLPWGIYITFQTELHKKSGLIFLNGCDKICNKWIMLTSQIIYDL